MMCRDEGRTCFGTTAGASIHPLVFDSPLSKRQEIIDYQVLQTTDGATIRLLCEGDPDRGRAR